MDKNQMLFSKDEVKDLNFNYNLLFRDAKILRLKRIAIQSKFTSMFIFICLFFISLKFDINSLFCLIIEILCLIGFIILTIVDVKRIENDKY